MKKIFVISIIATMFFVSCSGKGKAVLEENAASESATTENKIEIVFEKYEEKENVFPESIIKINKKEIEKIYWKKDYDTNEIAVCLDRNDTLNIIHIKNGEYTSICQLQNWTGGEEYVYENEDVDSVITEFDNILGGSGIRIRFTVGAAANDIFYITTDQDEPSLLLSAGLSGAFSEFDIDGDGTKELLSFDEYMYIKMNNTIYKATYDYDENQIQLVYFDEKLEDFVVYFSDKTSKEYVYDPVQRCLIEK